MDRNQCCAETTRSRLALVAAREGKRSEMRDQSRRARSRAAAGFVVRRRRGAERVADETRRDELPAAGGNRGGARKETVVVAAANSRGTHPSRVLLDAPRVQPFGAGHFPEHLELFGAFDVFREGAENRTRGACAPQLNFEF